MTFLIVLALYFVIVFVIALLARRAVGMPSLALAAGSVLAKLWTDSLTPLIASVGLAIVRPPLSSIVAIALTLIPALLVMIRARKVKRIHRRIVGSLVFAALAIMLTYGAFADAVIMDTGSRQYISQLLAYDKAIITAAIVYAVGSILFYKKPVVHDEKKK